MITIQCQACQKNIGKIDEARIPAKGAQTICPHCKNKIHLNRKSKTEETTEENNITDKIPTPSHESTPKKTNKPIKNIVLTNIDSVPGYAIVEHYGLVSGSTVRAKHLGRDIMAGLKNLVGGELKGYTELLQDSRKQAVDRMISQAKTKCANAIINVRFATSSVAQGAAELYVYGTAVKVE